jgi:hypothetical protein
VSKTSVSSTSAIQQRFIVFCKSITLNPFQDSLNSDQIHHKFFEFLHSEYSLIPEKERIGKGAVFITKACSQALITYLSDLLHVDLNSKELGMRWSAWCSALFHSSQQDLYLLQDLAISAIAEWIRVTKDPITTFEIFQPQILQWATNDDWIIREISCEPLRSIGINPSDRLYLLLNNWVKSEDPNIRRWVSESFRPLNPRKWLRDTTQNDRWLSILSTIRADPSEYVRKSVGNNLKDLSKYMPEKILALGESWIYESKIPITPEISSKTKKELGDSTFYLIWTLKHAFRWLQERNPEYHERISRILGTNYVDFFNEKKNRMAKGTKSKA